MDTSMWFPSWERTLILLFASSITIKRLSLAMERCCGFLRCLSLMCFMNWPSSLNRQSLLLFSGAKISRSPLSVNARENGPPVSFTVLWKFPFELNSWILSLSASATAIVPVLSLTAISEIQPNCPGPLPLDPKLKANRLMINLHKTGATSQWLSIH